MSVLAFVAKLAEALEEKFASCFVVLLLMDVFALVLLLGSPFEEVLADSARFWFFGGLLFF